MPVIAVINKTTLASHDDVAAYVTAQQMQINRDAAYWYGPCQIVLCGPTDPLPVGAWPLLLCDTDNDVPDALGWHDVEGLHPAGYVPLSLSIDNGDSWTATASHEVLEMIGDPYTVRVAWITYKGRHGITPVEVCDPVESDEYQIAGVQVSNFVLPTWFASGRHSPGTRFDFLNKLAGPFPAMTAGGYFSVLTDWKHWQQVFGKGVKDHMKNAGKWSRRARRLKKTGLK